MGIQPQALLLSDLLVAAFIRIAKYEISCHELQLYSKPSILSSYKRKGGSVDLDPQTPTG